jgi:hypothetical protein
MISFGIIFIRIFRTEFRAHFNISISIVFVLISVRNIQGVPGGKDLTPGECFLGQTIPI